jgi:hypothetical protein
MRVKITQTCEFVMDIAADNPQSAAIAAKIDCDKCLRETSTVTERWFEVFSTNVDNLEPTNIFTEVDLLRILGGYQHV